MFSRFILFLVACIACANAFAPAGGRFLQRSVVSMSKDVAMPAPPKMEDSGKDVASTIADKCPKLSAAIKSAGLDGALAGVSVFAPVDSAVTGDISADVLKFHVSSNQQLPTRNGRSYVSLLGDKEVGIRVTVDTCESFALHGAKPPAKMAKVTDMIKCTNGYVYLVDGVLEPYDGDTPASMFLKNTEDANLHN